MTLRAVVACAALLAGCTRSTDAASPLPGGGYTYLVTPAGRMYRLLKAGPVIGAGGKKLGTMVSYAGEAREVARIRADAEELVAALGPEMEVGGETAIIIQAHVGYDPRKIISSSLTYSAVFERKDGRWVGRSPKAGEPKELEDVAESPRPPEDPSFPFDAPRMKDAAEAAARFVALIDAGDGDASMAVMSETYRSQISREQWRGLVARRSGVAIGAQRVPLYWMQTRNASVPMPSDRGAAIQYEVRSAQGGRFVERVTLFDEKDGWRPAGYAFQAVPRG
jgi:hypothetical protein